MAYTKKQKEDIKRIQATGGSFADLPWVDTSKTVTPDPIDLRDMVPGKVMKPGELSEKSKSEGKTPTSQTIGTSGLTSAQQSVVSKQQQALGTNESITLMISGKKYTLTKTGLVPIQPTIKLQPKEEEKTQPTIKLQPKEEEKTGISKLREEDSIVGAAIRVATDWRTTVALVGTLATVATLGGVLAAGGATAATEAAVVGRVSTSTFPALGIKIATNTKTIAQTTSLLTKAGMAVGAAATVGVTVGTYPFANFELAEAADKIGIAIFKAAEAGDLEEVKRLQEYLEEMVNPNVWESIINKIPYANVMQNVKKNVAAAQVSAKSIVESTKKKIAEAEKEREYYEEREKEKREYYEGVTEKAEQREKEKREYYEGVTDKSITREKEKREYYEGVIEDALDRELEKREYYEDVTAAAIDRELEKRDYYKGVVQDAEAREAEKRAYYEDVFEKKKGEPLTDEEKQTISDWNAGKSALNFKWLGL